MALIYITTFIGAPIERVFDLARSVDTHMATASHSGERAVEGRTSGLIEEGDTITWEAKHFGVKQRLKVKVTKLVRPVLFEDEMISGAFSTMSHQHRFAEKNVGTEMMDRFEFRAPLGFLGRSAEILFLKSYMTSFLQKRNGVLKEMAVSDGWRKYLKEEDDHDVFLKGIMAIHES